MTLAIACDDGMVSQHLGHCREFVFFDIHDGTVGERSAEANSSHEMGVLPTPLRNRKVDCVISGGMGPRAQQNLSAAGIDFIMGVSGPVDEVAAAYASGSLEQGESSCTHG